MIERRQAGARRVALVAETAADARDVIVEGESGILASSPPWDMPVYEPSKRRLTWAATTRIPWETQATTYSGDKPDQMRGPQFDTAWLDEFAKYKRADQVFPILDPAVRLGDDPRIYVSTTPVPTLAMRELVRDPQTVVTNESTFANIANLPTRTVERLRRRYDGTRIGRQELWGELLEDVEGALWTQSLIERNRGRLVETKGAHGRPPIAPDGHVWMIYDWKTGIFRPVPDFVRVVVAVDPAVSHNEDSDETGIVIVARGTDDHLYVLADLSCRLAAPAWAARVIAAYHEYEADRVIAEVNNGGELVEATIRVQDRSISYEAVRASRGKIIRAEPVAALYEQDRVHHLGSFPKLEDQMSTYVPGITERDRRGDRRGEQRRRARDSPDHMDALVWGASWLGVQPEPGPGIF